MAYYMAGCVLPTIKIFELTNIIDEGRVMDFVYLDFNKAFDKILMIN